MHCGWYQIILFDDTGTRVSNLPRVVTWKQNGLELNSNIKKDSPSGKFAERAKQEQWRNQSHTAALEWEWKASK